MSHIAIRAEGLSKRYRIGPRERYRALRDVLAGAIAAPAQWFRGRGAGGNEQEFIWALKDVSFEVREGEAAGLVGLNGAGKTTLLKILARVTQPTEGRAEIRGRMGTLLEVGTGFHPELSGRENVYLSGAVLGMKRREIEQRFDAIVAFAEVEKFIDTPLKHYSSGMQTRLAFAVAAHLEPEILLVDEVLSVGDLAFQKKCLGKMSEVARGGRTVIFVSHHMNQIRRLCERALWIDAGRIREQGPAARVVAAYETAVLNANGDARHAGKVFRGWEVDGGGNVVRETLVPLTFHFYVELAEPLCRGHFAVQVFDQAGVTVASWGFDALEMQAGEQELALELPCLPLRPGTYVLSASLLSRGSYMNGGDLVESWDAVPYLVVDPGTARSGGDGPGVLDVPASVRVRAREEARLAVKALRE